MRQVVAEVGMTAVAYIYRVSRGWAACVHCHGRGSTERGVGWEFKQHPVWAGASRALHRLLLGHWHNRFKK